MTKTTNTSSERKREIRIDSNSKLYQNQTAFAPRKLSQQFSENLHKAQMKVIKIVKRIGERAGIDKNDIEYKRLQDDIWDYMNRIYGLGMDEVIVKIRKLEHAWKVENFHKDRLPILGEPFDPHYLRMLHDQNEKETTYKEQDDQQD